MRPHVFYRFGCWHVFRPGLQTYRRLTGGGIKVLGEPLHGELDGEGAA